MQIREANKEDIPGVAKVATESFIGAFGQALTAQELQKEIKEKRSEAYFVKTFDTSTIFVAEEDGLITGYLQIIDTIYGKDSKYIERIYVTPGQQGKGIGSSLLKYALARSPLKDMKEVYLDVWRHNTGASKLYKSFGFKFTGKEIIWGIGGTSENADLEMVLAR